MLMLLLVIFELSTWRSRLLYVLKYVTRVHVTLFFYCTRQITVQMLTDFKNFFHCWIAPKICYKIYTTLPISP